MKSARPLVVAAMTLSLLFLFISGCDRGESNTPTTQTARKTHAGGSQRAGDGRREHALADRRRRRDHGRRRRLRSAPPPGEDLRNDLKEFFATDGAQMGH